MLTWGRKSGDTRPILRDGDVVARLRPLQIRDHATVDDGDTAWTYYARGDELFGRRSDAAEPTLRASRPTRRTWSVRTEHTDYRIEGFGAPRSRFTIARAGVDIGSSGTAGLASRRPTLDVDPSTPLEHQLFLLWVAFVMRGRPGVKSRKPGRGGGVSGPAPGTSAIGFGGIGGAGGTGDGGGIG